MDQGHLERVASLQQLPFVCLRFEAVAAGSIHLPDLFGSTLKGALGHHLRGGLQRAGLEPAAVERAYYVLFGSKGAGTGGQPNLSRPYVMELDVASEHYFRPGETLRFGINLFGRAIDYAWPVILSFAAIGAGPGLGCRRPETASTDGRFRLRRVFAVGLDGVESEVWCEGLTALRPLWPQQVGSVLHPWWGSVRALAVEYQTPMHLRTKRGPINRADLPALVRAIGARARALAADHCDVRLELDTGNWEQQAAAAQLIEEAVEWESRQRVSSYQETTVNLGGLVGRAVWVGALGALVPLLLLGQVLHVGKDTAHGLGAYRLRCLAAPAGSTAASAE